MLLLQLLQVFAVAKNMLVFTVRVVTVLSLFLSVDGAVIVDAAAAVAADVVAVAAVVVEDSVVVVGFSGRQFCNSRITSKSSSEQFLAPFCGLEKKFGGFCNFAKT